MVPYCMKDFRNQGSYDPRLVVEISGLLLLQVVSAVTLKYSIAAVRYCCAPVSYIPIHSGHQVRRTDVLLPCDHGLDF